MCSVPAKMPNKYFIYAGGRWCEVDLRRGRVEGFRQRARFCYLRGGRLEVGRTAAVLRALRALAAGAGGAARDSAPLPYRRPHRSWRDGARAHRCCPQHLHHSRCDVNANELAEKPAAVQAQESTPRKRKRSTSDESNGKSKQTKVGGNETKSPQKLASVVATEQEIVKKQEESQEKKSPQKKSVKVRANEEEKIEQCLLQSSSSEEVAKQKTAPQNKPGPKSSKNMVSDETRGGNTKTKTVVRGNEETKLVRSLLQASSDDDQVTKTRPKFTPQVKSDSDTGSSSDSKEAKEMCKELVIDDRDVMVLRGFLGRTAGNNELKRFDKDKEYKTRLFYKINPLVCLKRCGPLEKLLTQRLTLREFARHLGLRSVADVTPEKRYRMRHSTRQARKSASISSGSEKEKAVQPARRQLWNRDKELFSQSPRSSDMIVKPQIHRSARDSSSDTTDSDTEVRQHIRRHLERRASAKLNSERKETKGKGSNDNHSIVVQSDSDESSDTHDKKRTTARKSNANKDNESVVVSDDSSSSTDVKQRITRRRSKSTRDDDKSVLVSDTDKRKTRRNSIRAKTNESVLGSDDSDGIDQKQRKSTTKTRAKSASDAGSVVISDESEESGSRSSQTDELVARPTRRTRSQGPEKRVLREHNKSVIISDTDSNTQDRVKAKTKPKESDKTQKSVSDNKSKTHENKDEKVESRTRDRAWKEDNKTKRNEDTSNEVKKVTRSSIKGTDNEAKTKDATSSVSKKDTKVASNKTENSTNKRKEVKPGPSKQNVKENLKKTETDIDQDTSVISDSSDAFETSKHSHDKNKEKTNTEKRLIKRISDSNRQTNNKGRFLKQKRDNKDNESKNNANEKDKKANEGRIEKMTQKDKGYTKKSDSQTDKGRNKVLSDRIDKDKEGSESNTGNKKTENKGKENSRKAAAARSMFVKPVTFHKSSVPNGREYTSLEDHAIVAWLSVGNRERLVNGNSIWRELQTEYTHLTSQVRTWHSLRNRYLRYILPALGQLALPPAQVSRLRAAAAVGKLNNRSRRNSIVKQQRVISASTVGRLRFRPKSSSESDDSADKKAPAPPSPRRRPAASPSKRSPCPSKPSPPASPRATRLRARSSIGATPTPRKKPMLRL